MDAEQEISCPECGHEFAPAERTWSLCLECLTVVPPDGNWREHKTEECVRLLGMSHRFYSEDAALEAQQERIAAYRGSEK